MYFIKVVGIGSIISDHFNEKTRMYTYTYKVLLSSAKWQYQSKHSSGGKMSRSLLRVLLYCSMDGVTLQCVGSMESTNFAVRSTRQLRRRGQSQSQKKKKKKRTIAQTLTPSDIESTSMYPELLRYATNNNAELSTEGGGVAMEEGGAKGDAAKGDAAMSGWESRSVAGRMVEEDGGGGGDGMGAKRMRVAYENKGLQGGSGAEGGARGGGGGGIYINM